MQSDMIAQIQRNMHGIGYFFPEEYLVPNTVEELMKELVFKEDVVLEDKTLSADATRPITEIIKRVVLKGDLLLKDKPIPADAVRPISELHDLYWNTQDTIRDEFKTKIKEFIKNFFEKAAGKPAVEIPKVFLKTGTNGERLMSDLKDVRENREALKAVCKALFEIDPILRTPYWKILGEKFDREKGAPFVPSNFENGNFDRYFNFLAGSPTRCKIREFKDALEEVSKDLVASGKGASIVIALAALNSL